VNSTTAKFSIGDIIQHKQFDYRGVIVDVDPHFLGTEDWYRKMARSKPPKDRPWYHVLVDGQSHQTYVAERNLEPDEQARRSSMTIFTITLKAMAIKDTSCGGETVEHL